MTWDWRTWWSKIRHHLTFQGDHIEYLNKMPVVKLPVNSNALISINQLYSHTCWTAGNKYHSVYKQLLHVDTCGRLENCVFVFYWPSWYCWAGLTWWFQKCVLKDYMTNSLTIWNLIDVINRVFVSFEIIMFNIIINAVNNKYLIKRSWNNVEIHNSGFI